jgi:hypothetical protein
MFHIKKKQDWKSFQSLPAFRRRYQSVHKAQNRNVLLIAGKACNKLPAYGRKKACNSTGLRPVIKTVIFLQGCQARLPGKAARQGCQARLPGKAARQGCQARLPGKAARQGCQARMPGKDARQGYMAICAVWWPATAAFCGALGQFGDMLSSLVSC